MELHTKAIRPPRMVPRIRDFVMAPPCALQTIPKVRSSTPLQLQKQSQRRPPEMQKQAAARVSKPGARDSDVLGERKNIAVGIFEPGDFVAGGRGPDA